MSKNNSLVWGSLSLIPRPCPAFHRLCSTEKPGNEDRARPNKHTHIFPYKTCYKEDFSSLELLGSGSGRQSETNVQSQPTARVPEQVNCSTLQCQEDFSCSSVGNASLCLPVCGRWEEYSRSTVVAIDVVVILSAVIGFVSSIAVLVISCIRWNRM